MGTIHKFNLLYHRYKKKKDGKFPPSKVFINLDLKLIYSLTNVHNV